MKIPSPLDVRLYALLDSAQTGVRDLAFLCDEVVAGGANLLQLRDKHGSTRDMIAHARLLVARAASRVPVLVNDRVDVALASDADGVHLGQDDMDVRDARRLLGPQAIIGLTIKTPEQARAAPLDHLDYVCVGGVFATVSKNNPDPPVGLAGLRAMVDIFRARDPHFPVGAIAGIDEANAGDVIAAGADGVAVISVLAQADKPREAARHLRSVVDAALAARVREGGGA